MEEEQHIIYKYEYYLKNKRINSIFEDEELKELYTIHTFNTYNDFDYLMLHNIFYIFNDDELIKIFNYIIHIKKNQDIITIIKIKYYIINLLIEYLRMLSFFNNLDEIYKDNNIIDKLNKNYKNLSVFYNYLL